MRSLRYLNSILTVIAVLLTLNLYVAWNTTPAGVAVSFAEEAHAQEAGGISNAGAQRKEMIDLLKQLNVNVVGVKKTLDGGVRVTGDEAGAEKPKK